LEAAGLLRPLDQAPPIRSNPLVLSLNDTLAAGILLSKGGESYQTQASILGFFSQVQHWYGDTARYAGDPMAQVSTDYLESRQSATGEFAEVPVPNAPTEAEFDAGAAHGTHFIDFTVFAGDQSEKEYLRHIGLLDSDFRPVGPQALNLAQYLQQAASQAAN